MTLSTLFIFTNRKKWYDLKFSTSTFTLMMFCNFILRLSNVLAVNIQLFRQLVFILSNISLIISAIYNRNILYYS